MLSTRLHLPVLPLREVVLFPGVTTPIGAGRPGTLRAIDAALATPEKLVFAVSQRANLEQVSPDGLYTVGTIARIGQLQRGLAGIQLLLQGDQRGIALHYTETDGYLQAVVKPAAEQLPLDVKDAAFVALYREARERAAELGERSGLPEEVVKQVLANVTEPGRFADLVAGYLELPPGERQGLLEMLSVEERLRALLVHVQRQLSVLAAQEDIKSQVQEEIGERQREMILREQLKKIRAELGEDDDGDALDELRARLAALPLPDAARKEVDRELGRLGRMQRESMETQVIRTWLETIADLPWAARSEEKLDLAEAERILDQDHYALADVKDRVVEFLAVRARRARAEGRAEGAGPSASTGRSPILLFAGPPGVGKTSVAKSIARATGREYVRVSLGGARDEADIRGHRRTYVGAMAGRIVAGLRQAGTKNPVFLLDEIDKLGASFQGDPSAALLEVLDPAQNDAFTDHYLGVPFDLSEVLFIATANYVQNIPAPLLDRMEVVEFAGYTEEEKRAIARTYLVPRQLEENGVAAGELAVTDAALAEVVTRYTREAGVRQLERELGKLARKVARRLASGAAAPVTLDAADVEPLLGHPRVHPEKKNDGDQVGVATGMYYTPTGGDIMFVEASTMRGKGELVLTGQLGDVMKESARAAWTYARSHAAGLRIPDEMFERDLHVHVPAGAIPKDGPSAGVTMATALVSALSGRPVRHDIAMTGEITLRGRVLPIGGVKEKVLGALRAGLTRILLPKANAPQLDDLPPEARRRMEIFLVEDLGEVLALTLRGASWREGRLLFGDENPRDVTPLAAGFHH
ncbi:MAG: endopeptidase La [Gemmatimonadales bacterium]|nr:endopeptidase La [Gemmatimonadales bacterium]